MQTKSRAKQRLLPRPGNVPKLPCHEHGWSRYGRQAIAGVKDLGGMHVICTELHDAARVDRQLIGRCGRQGDPGSYCQYLSLDDEILRSGFGMKRYDQLLKLGKSQPGPFHSYAPMFRKAQRRVERKHFRDRMMLLHHERERTPAFNAKWARIRTWIQPNSSAGPKPQGASPGFRRLNFNAVSLLANSYALYNGCASIGCPAGKLG